MPIKSRRVKHQRKIETIFFKIVIKIIKQKNIILNKYNKYINN